MRITEPNVTLWAPRAENAARVGREPRSATIPSQLDRSPRDGWIDENALPYDQLELLARARAEAARDGARPQPRVEAQTPAPAPVAPPAARIDVTVPDPVEPTPQVDLLA